MKKDIKWRSKQIWILGIGIVLSTVFFSPMVTNAQVPLYYPYYSPTSYFTPPPVPFYYSAPIYTNYNYSYPAPLSAPSFAFSPPSPSLLRAAATTTILVPDITIPTTTTATTLPTTIIAPSITPSFLTPTIASLLINTGNPQVQTILAIASLEPSLLDNPLLLSSLINTGNSQVALILALLSL